MPAVPSSISTKGEPLQADARWVVGRTNSWHTRGFRKLAICTEVRTRVIEAFNALANAIIAIRRLVRLPLGHPTHPPTMTYPRDLLVML